MNPTIMRLALRSIVGGWRGVVLVALPVLLVVFAGVLRAVTGEPVSASAVIGEIGLALVVPLVALLAANGVLGPEIDDGSVVYLLSTPVSRYAVAASKFGVAAGTSVVLSVAGLLGATLAGGLSDRWLVVALVTGGGGAVLYAALFTALAAATRHGMIAGLIYVLVVEQLLQRFLGGFRFVSVRAVAERLGEVAADVDLPVADMTVGYAAVASLVLLVAGVVAAGWRLSRFQLRGDE
ncbi:integral membrane protein [Serinicoccus hydrothermalis]|uniref:Integral membrane protein n=1 Tax=Serinicoccus hydrothermalis TaxID=1758689 RepID=A0A1B1NFR3_9MICO|nr:ABC transporter permease [Serinicoccus hydrothermalis]ANS80264.1 integral membrane protein [Serinicoccus hydrothermalis]